MNKLFMLSHFADEWPEFTRSSTELKDKPVAFPETLQLLLLFWKTLYSQLKDFRINIDKGKKKPDKSVSRTAT